MFRENELRQERETTSYFNRLPEICFDPENILLEGWYSDELSAYRAKKVWEETLAHYFLLEPEEDFVLGVTREPGAKAYRLSCSFFSACARYAFWRITNEQAPEAQYIIETAHIPKTESPGEDYLTAPDMKALSDIHPLSFTENGKPPRYNDNWLSAIKRIFQKLSDQ